MQTRVQGRCTPDGMQIQIPPRGLSHHEQGLLQLSVKHNGLLQTRLHTRRWYQAIPSRGKQANARTRYRGNVAKTPQKKNEDLIKDYLIDILFQVCLGDRIIVDVYNGLQSDSTTMHWHGQHHRTTPYMDGVPYVTQCPILPGAMFRYHYAAATSGTHFWHSHSGEYSSRYRLRIIIDDLF